MTDNNSLLGYVVPLHTTGLEDSVTNALSFILSRRKSAREALSELLGDNGQSLPIEEVTTQPDVRGTAPDMACLDRDGKEVAFIESKFWAWLTRHQPVTYWKGLPDDRPAVLLFLAPESRVKDPQLWDELVDRLRKADHDLDGVVTEESLITARAKVGQRRLMLASWESLVDRLAQRTEEDGDAQASFDIAELRGLVDVAIKGRPKRDEELKQSIKDAVKRLEEAGWADAEGLTTGEGNDYFARYFRLAGASAALFIYYEADRKIGDKPLWLSFGRYSTFTIGVEAVYSSLAGAGEPVERHDGEVRLRIPLPDGDDRDAQIRAIVGELEHVAKLIHRSGPTYRK